MTISTSVRCAVGVFAGLALLAGCGESSPTFGPTTTMQPSSNRAVHPDHGRSWMDPAAAASDLLYVTDSSTYDAYVFTYPDGKLVGTLTNQNNPAGMCVDKKGDVYVTQLYGGGHIVEYKHGGTTPIKTLSDPSYEPGACSVDPTTGNLAVANIVSDDFTQGNLLIYPKASGTPQNYEPPGGTTGIWFSVNTIGYDNKGNLFFAGSCNSAFCAGELPKGGSSTENVTLSKSPLDCGTVEWDGKYITFDDQSNGTVYRYTFSGTTGTEVGSVTLMGSSEVDGSWIAGKTVVAPQQGAADALVYDYPTGGKSIKTITGLTQPFGSTISKVKRHHHHK